MILQKKPAITGRSLDGLVGRLRAVADEGYIFAREAAEEIERLKNYIEMDAYCPCCQETYVCEDGCTFMDDAPNDYKRMMFAREVLMAKPIQGLKND